VNPDPLRAEGTDWQRDPEPHPDTPWLLLAAVIVFVALGILVAVKR
jgi:hypothetical protein